MGLEEGKTYTLAQIRILLDAEGQPVQAVKKKLERLEVQFTVEGRGENSIIKINSIDNKFLLFCVFVLGMRNNRESVEKFRAFVKLTYSDDTFRNLSIANKKKYLGKHGIVVSENTISSFLEILRENDLLFIDANERPYIVVDKDGNFKSVSRSQVAQAYKAREEHGEEGFQKILGGSLTGRIKYTTSGATAWNDLLRCLLECANS